MEFRGQGGVQGTGWSSGDRVEFRGQYIHLMAEWCRKCNVDIWAWCLMPNHIHLIAVPHTESGLARAMGEAHRHYTRRINFREGWRGHLWQDRFTSFPMGQTHLLAATRYIEMNPVAAELVESPQEYLWSSARAHLHGENDGLVKVTPLLEMVGDWRNFLELSTEEELNSIHRHERTGRPLGSESFLDKIEQQLKRTLRPQKPGPKKS